MGKCLCHVKKQAQAELTPFSARSWQTLEKSCNQRKDLIWLLMKDHWKNEPRGGYYRQCYQEYTHVNKRGRPQLADVTSNSNISVSHFTDDAFFDTEPPVKRVSRSQIPPFHPYRCILCQKDKAVKNNGTCIRQSLTQPAK